MIQDYINFARDKVLTYLLPDTCLIIPIMYEPDGSGGWVETQGTPREYNDSTSIPCRINLSKQYNQVDVYTQEAVVTDYYLDVPYDMTIESDDIIEHSMKQYQIKKLSDDGSWSTSRRALIVLVR